MQWYLLALKRYTQFDGRSRRREYWMFQFFNILVGVLLSFLDMFSGVRFNPETGLGLFGSVYVLFVMVPFLALSVRRLHDTNRSGWWMLAAFVPLLGGLWLLYLMCKDSDHGVNRFGTDPTTIDTVNFNPK